MNTVASVRSFCALLLGCAALGAAGQTSVYRCGPEGREYSSTPCPGGKVIDVDDARSDEQRRQAKDAARRQEQQAEQMAAQRRQRDAAAAKPTAKSRPAADPRPTATPASKPKADQRKKKSPVVDADFKATSPRPSPTDSGAAAKPSNASR